MAGPLSCPKCHATLLGDIYNQPDMAPCPACQTPLQVEIFPAFFTPINSGDSGQPVLVEGESSCYYHPGKRAVIPCESCGRFLCALCDIDLNGEHFCPACLERGAQKGKLPQLTDRRTRYDDMALSVAILPLLFWPVTLVTSPMVIYIGIRYWKRPLGVARRTHARTLIAMALALVQIFGWTLLLYKLITKG